MELRTCYLSFLAHNKHAEIILPPFNIAEKSYETVTKFRAQHRGLQINKMEEKLLIQQSCAHAEVYGS